MKNTLAKVVDSACRDCLDIELKDHVAIITDEVRMRIADAFAQAILNQGAFPYVFLVTKSMDHRWAESQDALDMLKSFVRTADVAIVMLSDNPSLSEFRKRIVQLCKAFPVRIAALPGISEETLVKYMELNPFKVENLGLAIARLITEGSTMQITTQ